jgi:hypothetical protein
MLLPLPVHGGQSTLLLTMPPAPSAHVEDLGLAVDGAARGGASLAQSRLPRGPSFPRLLIAATTTSRHDQLLRGLRPGFFPDQFVETVEVIYGSPVWFD